MKKYAVIVAGGSGTRMGGGVPKQFRSLNNRPVLWWSMKAFHEEDPGTNLILVLPMEFMTLWEDYFNSLPEEERYPHRVVAGGSTRTESVVNGLEAVEDPESLVAVHDGARPLVTQSLISTGWKTALEHGAAIPVVPVTDSLRKIDGDGSRVVDRKDFVAVQTPQVFISRILKDAYSQAGDKTFTDDTSVVEGAGKKVALFEGNPENIKLTNPKDLEIAKAIMNG